MNSQDAVGLFSPLMALIFAFTFIMIGTFRKSDSFAPVMGFAFVLIAAGLYVPWAYADAYPIGHAIAADTLCTLTIFPIAHALIVRQGSRPPWFILTAISACWLLVSYYLVFTEETYNLRFTLGSIVAATLIIAVLFSMKQAQEVPLVEELIYAVLVLTAMQMIVRPIFTLITSPPITSANLVGSLEWTVFNFIAGVTILALGLLFLAVSVLDMVDDLRHQARSDAGTGLLNRRGFESCALKAIDKAKADNRSLSLIVCDIDRFKSVNDIYGHSAGDLVLRSVADVLESSVRKGDRVGRIGGEEFAILLSATDVEIAAALAQAMCLSIEMQNFPAVVSNHKVTASFGVAALEENDTYQSLFERADMALYKAKDCGRNRVVIESDKYVLSEAFIKRSTVRGAFA